MAFSFENVLVFQLPVSGADLGGGCWGGHPPPPEWRGGSGGGVGGGPPPPPEMKWFIGVKVEQETSARPPKKNPGSAPECSCL